MKLAFCLPSLSNSGGIERVLINKINYLSEQFGYKIFIVTTEIETEPPFFPLSQAIEVISLQIDFQQIYSLGLLQRFRAYQKKMKAYKVSLENFLRTNQVDYCTSLMNKELHFLADLDDKSIKVCECHFSKYFLLESHSSTPINYVLKYIRYLQCVRSIKQIDQLVLLTDSDVALWKGIDNKTVIPNSLPYKAKEISKCKEKKIIAVGRLSHEKGFDMLIEVWKKLEYHYPDWSLHLYGHGEWDSKLKALIHQYGLKNIHIHPPVKNIQTRYAESSLLVMSSRYEGFGMVLIEAMAAGLPCVSFDCPSGPAHIILDGETGYLVPACHTVQMAERIKQLLDNESLRQSMGRKAQERAKAFSENEIMNQWKVFYEINRK